MPVEIAKPNMQAIIGIGLCLVACGTSHPLYGGEVHEPWFGASKYTCPLGSAPYIPRATNDAVVCIPEDAAAYIYCVDNIVYQVASADYKSSSAIDLGGQYEEGRIGVKRDSAESRTTRLEANAVLRSHFAEACGVLLPENTDIVIRSLRHAAPHERAVAIAKALESGVRSPEWHWRSGSRGWHVDATFTRISGDNRKETCNALVKKNFDDRVHAGTGYGGVMAGGVSATPRIPEWEATNTDEVVFVTMTHTGGTVRQVDKNWVGETTEIARWFGCGTIASSSSDTASIDLHGLVLGITGDRVANATSRIGVSHLCTPTTKECGDRFSMHLNVKPGPILIGNWRGEDVHDLPGVLSEVIFLND